MRGAGSSPQTIPFLFLSLDVASGLLASGTVAPLDLNEFVPPQISAPWPCWLTLNNGHSRFPANLSFHPGIRQQVLSHHPLHLPPISKGPAQISVWLHPPIRPTQPQSLVQMDILSLRHVYNVSSPAGRKQKEGRKNWRNRLHPIPSHSAPGGKRHSVGNLNHSLCIDSYPISLIIRISQPLTEQGGLFGCTCPKNLQPDCLSIHRYSAA